MESESVIGYMIGACILVVLFLFFSEKFKLLGKFLFNGVIGSIGIYIINNMFSSFGIFVGLNLINFIVVGLMGIPGLISLYVINAFL